MTRHLQTEIDRLKKRVLYLTAKVEEALQAAVTSVEEQDVGLAENVVAEDEVIDRLEVELEEECLKILALHQPVAIDLRFVVAALKINSDLERIGDLAVNIAQQTRRMGGGKAGPTPFDLSDMLSKAMAMVKKSADALVDLDANLGREVCEADDALDACHHEALAAVERGVRENPDQAAYYLCLLSISRNLERIGDHATNISEDVIYMVEGEIVRHRVAESRE
jgi:phosphate transport system protein